MGIVTSSDSRNKKAREIGDVEETPEPRCRKHENTVTHYNADTGHLYCLTCYQDFKRGKSPIDHVHEISGFLSTTEFKQSEVNILHKLNECKRTSKLYLDKIKRSKKAVELNRQDICIEISKFVKHVVKILLEEEQTVVKETSEKALESVDKLNALENEVTDRFNQLESFEEEIVQNRRERKHAKRLYSITNIKKIMEKGYSKEHELSCYDFRLLINKKLTFEDMFENEGAKRRIGLASISSRETTHKVMVTGDSNKVENDKSLSERNIVSKHKQVKPDIIIQEETVEISDKNKMPVQDSADFESFVSNKEAKSGKDSDKDTGKDTDKDTGKDSGEESERNRGRSDSISPRFFSNDDTYPGKVVTPPLPVIQRGIRKKQALKKTVRVKEVKLPIDEHIPNITDSVILDDGRIVLCDQKNERLILLSEAFEIINEQTVTGHPHNLTQIPNTDSKILVAVTIPDENVIKIVELKDNAFNETLEVIKLQTKPKCLGIEYVDRYLVYTSRNDLTVVKREELSNSRKFSYNFHSPVSLGADREKGFLYVSCLGVKARGEVVKINCFTENVDFVVSCDEIQHPVCSTYDLKGNIYICNIDPPSIHQVSSDGRYFGQLLDSSDGNFQHVNFIRRKNMLLTTANDSDTILIYKMD